MVHRSRIRVRALEVTGSGGHECVQVRCVPKPNCQQSLLPHLEKHGLRIHSHHMGTRGDVFVTFQSPSEARRALQALSLTAGAPSSPVKSATDWVQGQARKCYAQHDTAQFHVVPTSLAYPIPADAATILAVDILPLAARPRGPSRRQRASVSYMCSKCTVLPLGVLPVVLAATYPPVSIRDAAALQVLFRGVREEMPLPRADVIEDIHFIRNGMDSEIGRPATEVARAVEERARAVVSIMERLFEEAPHGPRGQPLPFLCRLAETQLLDFAL